MEKSGEEDAHLEHFWYPKTLDFEGGGYHLNHDAEGKPLGKKPKMIVAQSRMFWYFSKLYNSGWAGKEALEAAGHGFSFLRDKCGMKSVAASFGKLTPKVTSKGTSRECMAKGDVTAT